MTFESGKMYLASDKKHKNIEKTVGCARTPMYIFCADKLIPSTENDKMVVIIQNKWQNKTTTQCILNLNSSHSTMASITLI